MKSFRQTLSSTAGLTLNFGTYDICFSNYYLHMPMQICK